MGGKVKPTRGEINALLWAYDNGECHRLDSFSGIRESTVSNLEKKGWATVTWSLGKWHRFRLTTLGKALCEELFPLSAGVCGISGDETDLGWAICRKGSSRIIAWEDLTEEDHAWYKALPKGLPSRGTYQSNAALDRWLERRAKQERR